MRRPVAVVAGAGPVLGQALCRNFVEEGYGVASLSRSAEEGEAHPEIRSFRADLTQESELRELFRRVEGEMGPVEVLVYNAGQLLIEPFLEMEPARFERLWRNNCFGAVLAAQQVLPSMLERGSGTVLFSGATASLRGAARFSAFASSKFALRALAQSLAREFGPRGIHVAHVIVDGLLWGGEAQKRFGAEESQCLAPQAVAQTYLSLVRQAPSAWTHELDLRPYGEKW